MPYTYRSQTNKHQFKEETGETTCFDFFGVVLISDQHADFSDTHSLGFLGFFVSEHDLGPTGSLPKYISLDLFDWLAYLKINGYVMNPLMKYS